MLKRWFLTLGAHGMVSHYPRPPWTLHLVLCCHPADQSLTVFSRWVLIKYQSTLRWCNSTHDTPSCTFWKPWHELKSTLLEMYPCSWTTSSMTSSAKQWTYFEPFLIRVSESYPERRKLEAGARLKECSRRLVCSVIYGIYVMSAHCRIAFETALIWPLAWARFTRECWWVEERYVEMHVFITTSNMPSYLIIRGKKLWSRSSYESYYFETTWIWSGTIVWFRNMQGN